MQQENKKAFLYPPGGILIWIVILVELVTFAAGLIIFSIQRLADPELFFNSGQLLFQELALRCVRFLCFLVVFLLLLRR